MLTGNTLATFAVGASIKRMFAASWTFLHLRRPHSYTESCSLPSKNKGSESATDEIVGNTPIPIKISTRFCPRLRDKFEFIIN